MSKTLLLTSMGMAMQDEILKILPKPIGQLKLAHIMTATKKSLDHEWYKNDFKIMRQLGFQIEDIDIEGKSKHQVEELLKDKDIIYMQGGDPFYLLKHLRLSEADKVISQLVNNGVIYIGHSAGTWVAQPTLEAALWQKPSRERYGITDISAMNLVPFVTSVHFKQDEKHSTPDYIGRIRQGVQASKYPTYVLTDQQAVLYMDGITTLVGTGPKVQL